LTLFELCCLPFQAQYIVSVRFDAQLKMLAITKSSRNVTITKQYRNGKVSVCRDLKLRLFYKSALVEMVGGLLLHKQAS